METIAMISLTVVVLIFGSLAAVGSALEKRPLEYRKTKERKDQ